MRGGYKLATQKRRFILGAVCGLVLALPSIGFADWWLVWDPAVGSVEGYKVYYGTSYNNLTKSIKVGNVTEYNLNKLPLKENVQYFITVSAFNAVMESDPAAPVAFTPEDSTPPSPPTGFKATALP